MATAPLPPNDDDEPTGPRRMVDDDFDMPSIPPTAAPTVAVNVNTPSQSTSATAAMAQANAQVGLAQVAVEEKVIDQQIRKEEEHWVKAYWRPAMGWLYMLICFVDFVVFPVIAMFLPVIYKGVGLTSQYVPWASLTLANGGLVHLAFGAILGVAAWTRGQEKIANIK